VTGKIKGKKNGTSEVLTISLRSNTGDGSERLCV